MSRNPLMADDPGVTVGRFLIVILLATSCVLTPVPAGSMQSAAAVDAISPVAAPTGPEAAVATEAPEAAAAAVEVLRRGGNAVDAAVTAVFAIGVVRPEACGIGGGGFLVYRSAKGETATLDFREISPARGYAYSRGIGVPDTPLYSDKTGHNVVGVPGLVAGMAAALERYGTIDLAAAVAPAAALARHGFTVSPPLAAALEYRKVDLTLFPESARVYLKNGTEPYRQGDRLVLPDYANTLETIGREGATTFYAGSIAALLALEMARPSPYPGGQSAMTMADLASYEATWRRPLTGTYRGRTVIAMPPPTSGGVAVLEVLNIVAGFDLGPSATTADRIHLLAEAQKIAWADRAAYLGDPDAVDVPVDQLIDRHYAAERRAEIDNTTAQDYEPGRFGADPTPAAGAAPSGMNTTHVSVVDRGGNAVAVTCSLEQALGSAVVAPGTGFLLNNTLTDFAPPGSGSPNEAAPAKRPLSSMTPLIVAHHDRSVLVTGGSGGPTIINGAVQMIVNTVDRRLDPAAAMDAPRADARGFGVDLAVEDARIDPATLADLVRRGHVLHRLGAYAAAPRMTAAGITSRNDRFAASDPRGESGSAVI